VNENFYTVTLSGLPVDADNLQEDYSKETGCDKTSEPVVGFATIPQAE
jgi:hypothetical protein